MNQEPILVYQMGKVGSSSIANALAAVGLPIFHVHVLRPEDLVRHAKRSQELGVPLLGHLQRSIEVKEKYLDKGRPVKIITAVRDPIARNISAYFQNLGDFRTLKQKFEEDELTDMMTQFLKAFQHDIALTWFDTQMRDVLGIDVYKYPFPKSEGVQRLQENKIDVLLLKTEVPDDIKVSALREFLQIPELSLEAKNVGAEKAYKHYYKAFRDRIQLPEAYLKRMYESRYAQHFYSLEEISRFRDRWMRDRSSSEKGAIPQHVS